ncbi:hypothetical protein [Variovorax sp. PvP013]|jgi:hypothetical protein|uniref:hypothetical protein n=1 Tax=Variovorax sp. PvP013 TaxID=3156435 RepID=UPI003D23A75D
MDRHTFLEEVHVDLAKSGRHAVATLRRYEDGWLVHRVVEEERPDVEEHVDVFPDRDVAVKAAEKMWIP